MLIKKELSNTNRIELHLFLLYPKIFKLQDVFGDVIFMIPINTGCSSVRNVVHAEVVTNKLLF